MPTQRKSISKKERTHQFQKLLLSWYRVEGRSLPWRTTRDPYAIVVSELMLQQTQVSRVLPKYAAWMKKFPTLKLLASAPLREVLFFWQGLGYNRRAKYLWLMAQQVMEKHQGTFPKHKSDILLLPGIGPHTAGAVMSFAFGQQEAIFDTNAVRVVGRVLHGYKTLPQLSSKQIVDLLNAALPTKTQVYQFNQAVMDLGAMICTAKKPTCERCPLQSVCRSYPDILTAQPAQLRLTKKPKETLYFGQPRRIWRGKILRYLHTTSAASVTLAELGSAIQPDFHPSRLPWLSSIVQLLAKEGMVCMKANRITLP